jgi:hypothetical protein
MNTEQWITVASLATVVVSALAIVTGLKSVRDQLRVTIFLEYTKRYSEIMQHMPFSAREPGGRYRLPLGPDGERNRILSAFREYLNMCSEEKWLYDHHRIDRAAWGIWERGMRDTASFPSFGDAWRILCSEYDAYPDFQKFVSTELLSKTSSTDESDQSLSS